MKNILLNFKDEQFVNSLAELYSISKVIEDSKDSLTLVDSTSTRKDKLGEEFIYKMYETKYKLYIDELRFNYIVNVDFNLLVSENVTTTMSFKFNKSTGKITTYSIISPNFGDHSIEINVDEQNVIPMMEVKFIGTVYRILLNYKTNEIIETNMVCDDKRDLNEFYFEFNNMIESFKIKDKLNASITLHRNLYRLYEVFCKKILRLDLFALAMQGKSYLDDLYEHK